MKVHINLAPGKISVNNVDFSGMLAEEQKQLIWNISAHNYPQIPGWIVVSPDGECGLRLKRTVDGKDAFHRVLDFQSMYSTNNLGYGEIYRRIVETIIQGLKSGEIIAIPRAMDHEKHAPALAAMKIFTGLDRFIMKSGGAETVETAVHAALCYWHGRKKGHCHTGDNTPRIISARGCFHGRTSRARSLSTSPSSREGFGPLHSNVLYAPFNDVPAIESLITVYKNEIAAIILEPIQGEGGVIIPSDDYLPRVSKLCAQNGILFILDEIQTGFGRTGSDWTFEQYGIKPDILCSGKAAGCGIAPVSFVAGRDDVLLSIKEGTEGATWSATPIQCLLVLSAIKELCDNNLSEASKRKGAVLRAYLEELWVKYPRQISAIRGRGLFIGIDTIWSGKEVSKLLLEEGVWAKETGEKGKTLRLSPPLVISLEEIRNAVCAFERVIKKLNAKATM